MKLIIVNNIFGLKLSIASFLFENHKRNIKIKHIIKAMKKLRAAKKKKKKSNEENIDP